MSWSTWTSFQVPEPKHGPRVGEGPGRPTEGRGSRVEVRRRVSLKRWSRREWTGAVSLRYETPYTGGNTPGGRRRTRPDLVRETLHTRTASLSSHHRLSYLGPRPDGPVFRREMASIGTVEPVQWSGGIRSHQVTFYPYYSGGYVSIT